VVGCGAPVLPVVGLVFAGLSSGTLALLSGASRVLSAVVLVALTLVVAWLGRRAGSGRPITRAEGGELQQGLLHREEQHELLENSMLGRLESFTDRAAREETRGLECEPP